VVGSVANAIVLELAGPEGQIGFWRFLRPGAVVTGATLAVGLGILLLVYSFGWI
jgi:Na+/H+ antiporter NhaD/arsenite permease-like protein